MEGTGEEDRGGDGGCARREEERMRLELEEQRRLEREREAREAFERKLRDLGRKTSGGDDATWVQGSDASEEGHAQAPRRRKREG